MVGAIAMYTAVIIPNLRLLSDPTNLDLLNRSSIRTERDSAITAAGGTPPDAGYTDPLSGDERISALRIIAATNTIVMGLLIGVLTLQGAEVYMEDKEKKEADKRREEAAEELRAQLKGKGKGSEGKKDQ